MMTSITEEDEIEITERVEDPTFTFDNLSEPESGDEDIAVSSSTAPQNGSMFKSFSLVGMIDSNSDSDEKESKKTPSIPRVAVIEEDLLDVRYPVNSVELNFSQKLSFFEEDQNMAAIENGKNASPKKITSSGDVEKNYRTPEMNYQIGVEYGGNGEVGINNDETKCENKKMTKQESLEFCTSSPDENDPQDRVSFDHASNEKVYDKEGEINYPTVVIDTVDEEQEFEEIKTTPEPITQDNTNIEKEFEELKVTPPKTLTTQDNSDSASASSQKQESTVMENSVEVIETSELNLSPKNLEGALKPKKVKVAHKHNRGKFDDILQNYDIIDRREAKHIKPVVQPFSFLNLIAKFRKVEPPIDATKKDSFTHSTTIVNLTVQQTSDGEQMQLGESGNMYNALSSLPRPVITVAPINKDTMQDEKDGDVIIFDNQDMIDGEEVTDSESDLSEDEGLDFADSKTKSYKLPLHDDDVPKGNTEIYRSKSNAENVSTGELNKSGLNRGGISKSFGAADGVGENANKYRRTTLGPAFTILPFQGSNFGTFSYKKKTLPNEPFFLITDGFPPNIPSFPSDRRSLIAQEIYTTERTFVRGMEIIVMLFKRRIEMSGTLDAKELKLVFSNIDVILEGNKNILDEIFVRINEWSDEQCIGDIFLKYNEHFKIYSEYAQNYDSSEEFIKQKLKKKKDMDSLLTACYSNPICIPGLTLPSYLITVIQRIPRYILLLKDLIKRTNEDHPDYENLVQSKIMMEKVAKYINEQLKQAQCAKALEALQTQITGLKAYQTPGRTLVHEGDVCLLTSKKTYHCVLFKDLLVFAVKGGMRQSCVELTLDLKSVWIEDLEDLDPQTTKKDAIGIYTPERPYTMYVGTNGEKKIWLQHLTQTIQTNLDKIGAKIIDTGTRETNFTYKDETMYSGYFHKAKRHGQGTLMWPNRMTYTGNWQDNERNGHGVLEYLTGDKYDGEWMDDKQEGKGTFTYKNGDVVTGNWRRGKKHGEVEINYANGDWFHGQFRYDRIDGHGELRCRNGLHYKGEWKFNKRHGKGTLTTTDILEYSGNFENNKFHGYGELRYTDGSIYKGEFERGERCGNGVYTVPGGVTYNGQWLHDLKDGKGVMEYENGDVYNGTWISDMRIGQGVITYNYGGFYRGQWQADLRHGNGIFESKDGCQYDGEFLNNKMCGSGKMKYKDGSMYNGYWNDNLPNGKGILTKPGGFICDGNWILGKQTGLCVLRDPINSYSYEGEWVDGVKEGYGKETINKTTYEGGFSGDQRQGSGKEKFEDGTVYEGKWENGLKNGRGVKTKIRGFHEQQIWDNGNLLKTNINLPQVDLPELSKWL